MLIAAGKGDRKRVGEILPRHQRQSLDGFSADEVLHVNGLAGAQQRPIENRVGDVRRRLIFGRQMKSPRLDSLLPT